MTVVVTHTTPADGTFSATGAAAWNADHALVGVGTMAEQDASNVAITGGTINNTVIGNTTPNAATFTTLTATGQTSLGGVEGSESLRVTPAASAVNYVEIFGASAADGRPLIRAAGASAAVELRLSSKSTSNISFWTNNAQNRQFQVTHAASAVNFVQVTGAATNNRPTASSQGSDTDIGFNIVTKGSGTHNFASDANIGTSQFQVTRTQASAVNYLTATGAATNFSPRLFAAGSDTNISQVFQSKGTGAINLAPGSSGVNISNGGTVTAITRTANGSYTSVPSVALSAPTTAGGVQATATCYIQNTSATIASGGTGYTVGDTITMVGGTLAFGGAGTFRVATVSGGVITSVDTPSFAGYNIAPTNPVSVTGGTGSGATLNVTYIVGAFAITNAGSGYVEQPTVTFSGGGGSGAAAYATVGSGTIIRSLGSTMSFSTPVGEAFRILEYFPTGTSANYVFASGRAASNPPVFGSAGSDTNVSLAITSKGTGGIALTTSNGAFNQLQVAHTASAVNFVQVTGAATGVGPTISTQGSDANVGMAFRSKGSGFISFGQDSTNQFEIIRTASAVNRLRVTGSTAGNAPIMASEGTDTNIDLALTPKGTGNVRFGTYTANMALTIQGYVEIKDSGGTIRRLAVIA